LKKSTKSLISLLSIFVITLSPIGLHAYHSENRVGMYDGALIAAVDVSPGDWGSRAEYTGWNPKGLSALLLQTQIQGRDYHIRMFNDWAPRSAAGNIWIVRTGGSNSAGTTGNNYARAIGYYHTGGTQRVATAYQ